MNVGGISSGVSSHYTAQRYGESVLQQQIRQVDINRGHAVARAAGARLAEIERTRLTIGDYVYNIINNQSTDTSPTLSAITQQPTARSSQQQDSMSALTYEDIKDQITGPDILTAFKKYPQFKEIAYQLFDELAEQHLPPAFRKTVLSTEGQRLRTLTGILCKDIDPDLLYATYRGVGRGGANFRHDSLTYERTVSVLSRFGNAPLSKFVETFQEHCRSAWKLQHPGHPQDVSDEDMFSRKIYAYQDALNFTIEQLTQDNHIKWTDIGSKIYYFRELTVGLSTFIKYNEDLYSPVNKTEPLLAQADPQDKILPQPVNFRMILDDDGNYVDDTADKIGNCVASACKMFCCCLIAWD